MSSERESVQESARNHFFSDLEESNNKLSRVESLFYSIGCLGYFGIILAAGAVTINYFLHPLDWAGKNLPHLLGR